MSNLKPVHEESEDYRRGWKDGRQSMWDHQGKSIYLKQGKHFILQELIEKDGVLVLAELDSPLLTKNIKIE